MSWGQQPGYPPAPQGPQPPSQQRQIAQGGKLIKWLAISCVAAFVLAIGLAVLNSWLNPEAHKQALAIESAKAREDAERRRSGAARAQAEHVVKNSLKAPDSAEFGPGSCSAAGPAAAEEDEGGESEDDDDATVWLCSGQVTAQNVFGVHLRQHWAVRLLEEDGRWTVVGAPMISE